MQQKSKIGTVYTLFGLALTGKKFYIETRDQYHQYQARKSFQISISESNKLFSKLEEWVLTQLSENDQKSVGAKIEDKRLKFFYTGSKEHFIRLNNHRIKFSLSESEIEKDDSEYSSLQKRFRPRSLIFTAEDLSGRQEILNLLEKISKEISIDPPRLKIFRWGEWTAFKDLPNRPLESVVLKSGQLERIVDDFQKFLDSESRYQKIGAPFHRGYVFHGPPGSGKSSLAVVLARHFGMDLNFCSLGDIKTDSDLIRVVSEAKGILLIEDADVFENVVESREKQDDAASLSGLLNALDGVSTPDGLVTIITTNNVDKLDSALLRSGRIDLIEEIGYLDTVQLEKLFYFVYSEELGEIELKIDMAPSDIIEVFKKTEDPTEARILIKEILRNKEA